MSYWYAVQKNNNDDWSYGSYNIDEAIKMARKLITDYPDAIIAVIDNSTKNPVCVSEIRKF